MQEDLEPLQDQISEMDDRVYHLSSTSARRGRMLTQKCYPPLLIVHDHPTCLAMIDVDEEVPAVCPNSGGRPAISDPETSKNVLSDLQRVIPDDHQHTSTPACSCPEKMTWPPAKILGQNSRLLGKMRIGLTEAYETGCPKSKPAFTHERVSLFQILRHLDAGCGKASRPGGKAERRSPQQ